MIFQKLTAQNDSVKCVIEQDLPSVGWYLFVYKNGQMIDEHLQDDLAICKDIAATDYGIPIDTWLNVNDNTHAQ